MHGGMVNVVIWDIYITHTSHISFEGAGGTFHKEDSSWSILGPHRWVILGCFALAESHILLFFCYLKQRLDSFLFSLPLLKRFSYRSSCFNMHSTTKAPALGGLGSHLSSCSAQVPEALGYLHDPVDALELCCTLSFSYLLGFAASILLWATRDSLNFLRY